MKNMEKKTYIKPEMEVLELEVETPMLTTSFEFNEDGGNDESLVNSYRPGRRGQWGNLWQVEK
jgi:hypothetical protein